MSESKCIHLAGGDLCQGEFPASGQGYVGDAFVGNDVVHGEPFLGRYQRPFFPTDVFAGDKGLDDGSSRCRGSESGVLHGFAFRFVVEFFSGGLHSCQQRVLRMQGTRASLLFQQVAFPHEQHVVFA